MVNINLSRKNLIIFLISLTVVFVVSAFNGCGNNGRLSGALEDVSTKAGGITAKAVSASQINLTWQISSASDVVGYKILRNGTIIAMISGRMNTAFANTGLSPSTTYTYEVIAFDSAGNEGSMGTPVTVTTMTQ
ncbi:MAG: hypothetical protein A4S09_07120 [Proteobacteria bacterium SG_bin7]|nr:MAG: hypothetical protein A4S09_07120 [Proteobacteria bacterium SG_bin7]